jgi:hypothetical protein
MNRIGVRFERQFSSKEAAYRTGFDRCWSAITTSRKRAIKVKYWKAYPLLLHPTHVALAWVFYPLIA